MLDSKFLQLVLWVECNSNCAFCLNKPGISAGVKEDKIANIKKAIQILEAINPDDYKFVGLIGGEFFQGQITPDVEPYFNQLLELIKLKIDNGLLEKVFVATSLMGPENYELFKKYFSRFQKHEVLVCTSYNEMGQFSLSNKENWQRNSELLLKDGYELHIEIIASEANLQAIMHETLDLTHWVENKVRIDFLRPISFDKKPHQDYTWFFPKRETFIQFMLFLEKRYPMMLDDFMSLKQRASELHNFTFDQTVRRKSEFDEGEGVLMPCGHSEMFKAYIDSDACMACDIIKFQKRNKYKPIDKDI